MTRETTDLAARWRWRFRRKFIKASIDTRHPSPVHSTYRLVSASQNKIRRTDPREDASPVRSHSTDATTGRNFRCVFCARSERVAFFNAVTGTSTRGSETESGAGHCRRSPYTSPFAQRTGRNGSHELPTVGERQHTRTGLFRIWSHDPYSQRKSVFRCANALNSAAMRRLLSQQIAQESPREENGAEDAVPQFAAFGKPTAPF